MMTDKIKQMVIEQFGDAEYFKESAPNIAQYGAAGGFSGFTYYSDTVPFGERLRPYIKPIMAEMAEEFGLEGVYSLMHTFRCCSDLSVDEIADAWASAEFENGEYDNHTQVMNCLAWFALEEVAREMVESEEVK